MAELGTRQVFCLTTMTTRQRKRASYSDKKKYEKCAGTTKIGIYCNAINNNFWSRCRGSIVACPALNILSGYSDWTLCMSLVLWEEVRVGYRNYTELLTRKLLCPIYIQSEPLYNDNNCRRRHNDLKNSLLELYIDLCYMRNTSLW